MIIKIKPLFCNYYIYEKNVYNEFQIDIKIYGEYKLYEVITFDFYLIWDYPIEENGII